MRVLSDVGEQEMGGLRREVADERVRDLHRRGVSAALDEGDLRARQLARGEEPEDADVEVELLAQLVHGLRRDRERRPSNLDRAVEAAHESVTLRCAGALLHRRRSLLRRPPRASRAPARAEALRREGEPPRARHREGSRTRGLPRGEAGMRRRRGGLEAGSSERGAARREGLRRAARPAERATARQGLRRPSIRRGRGSSRPRASPGGIGYGDAVESWSSARQRGDREADDFVRVQGEECPWKRASKSATASSRRFFHQHANRALALEDVAHGFKVQLMDGLLLPPSPPFALEASRG